MGDVRRKVAMLSNVTADLVAERLRGRYDIYLPAGYDTWVQEAADPCSRLYSGRFDAVIVLLDGTEARGWKNVEEGRERIRVWKQAVTTLAESFTAIPVFISTVDFRENRIRALSERRYRTEFENGWYQYIQGLAESNGNLYVFDLADLIAEIGRKRFYSNKMWYMGGMPYSREGLDAVSAEIGRILDAAFAGRKKIIVLDLDNTLWGGVVGEDGAEGIVLSAHKEGQRYYDFQRQLLEMKDRGILLAVNSKNNPEDAEAAIRGNPAMLLQDDDFVSRKINWKDKGVNIRAMEDELRLTEGGFIFIDDNPAEREAVRSECPEVLVPDFPQDTSELLSFAESIWFDHCMPLRVLDEDREKTRMYRGEALREKERRGSITLDEYLGKLEMSADIHRMRPGETERVAQLCGKTNQFNVTTKRYTRAEIEDMSDSPGNAVYVIYNSDKYGDNGLVGVIILEESDKEVKIDSFLMSCRVMGRKLEDVAINELAAKYADRQRIIGEFIPTAKNAPVRDLYDRLGFRMVSDDNGYKTYELRVSGYMKKVFASYKKITFEG